MRQGRQDQKTIVSLFVGSRQETQSIRFEIFVSKGFCELEVAAVTHTLTLANQILGQNAFEYRYVSDRPGVVSGSNNMLLRAEPAIVDYGFADVMIVVGVTAWAYGSQMEFLRADDRHRDPKVRTCLLPAPTTHAEDGGRQQGAHLSLYWGGRLRKGNGRSWDPNQGRCEQ